MTTQAKYKYTTLEEKFCQLVSTDLNQSDAYRGAGYSIKNMKQSTIHRQAKALMDKPKIMARVAELKATVLQRHNVTVDSLMIELEQARVAALRAETVQASAAVAATMGKAKLCGLDKLVVEATLKVTDSGGNEW